MAIKTKQPDQINGREKMTKQNKYHGKTIEIGSLTVIY
jgi:hypothetical protein